MPDSKKPTSRIRFAEGNMVALYAEEVRIVLGRLATFYGDSGISGAFVSDESYPSDFNRTGSPVSYDELSEAMGVEVRKGDAIWEIAKALQDHKRDAN